MSCVKMHVTSFTINKSHIYKYIIIEDVFNLITFAGHKLFLGIGPFSDQEGHAPCQC